jgi:mannose-6-phosphate isomerase-like protein (cupin superfamily)
MSSSKARLFCLLALIFLILTVASQSGCKRRAKGLGTLPQPPPDQVKYSDYKPDKPFEQIAPGVAARTLYSTDESNQYHVEIRDILIGPRQKASNIQLEGAAVFEVRQGNGLVVTGEKRQTVAESSTFALSEGEPFNFENSGENPVAVRMILLRAK